MIILDLLHEDGINPKHVAHTSGGEYASPCPLCGGQDRFRCWPEDSNGGRYWCRGCEKSGDCIQYLRDFRGLTYQDACSFLGVETREINHEQKPINKPGWEPKEIIIPPGEWQKKCSAFVNYCQDQLSSDDGKKVFDWLGCERGLFPKTIKTFRLGWNPKDLWRDRGYWGLPQELKNNGKPKKLWLPAGVVIPYFAGSVLQRARIRRFNPERGAPYVVVSGSSTTPMIISTNHKIFVIVESELDAILLYQEIGDMAGVIAVGSAVNRPDRQTTDLLRKSELILIALDSDDTGIKEAYGWWENHFTQAIRLPPVDGKDPAEMWKAGVNLREWVDAGIELSEEEENSSFSADELKSTYQANRVDPCQGADLISNSILYLAGAGEADFTGWTLWRRVEQGKEHRFAIDPNKNICWERQYLNQ